MTRRVTQAPGGASTISFGDYTPSKPPPATPSAAAAAAAPAEPATPAPAAPVPADAAPADTGDFEDAKGKTIAALAQVKPTPEVEALIKEFLEKLQASGSAPRAVLSADDSLEKLKAALKQRGTHGIISLGHKFKSMDDSGDNKLDFAEFRKAMLEMNLTEADTHRLFRYFDADCSGYLSFDELLVGLRGQLSARRLDMVQRAFKVLDVTGDGQVTLEDLKGRYDASKHPDVLLGTKTQDQVLTEFLGTFEAQGGGDKGDGVVTFDEFKKYYESISASVDLDDYFELLIRNAWHISGGEGWCANTTCKRVLVQHTDGSQSVREVEDDFDVSKEQYLDKLQAQGVKDIESIALYYSDAAASATTAAAPAANGKGVPSTPTSPTPSTGAGRFTASAGKKGADHFRSSIQFG